MDTDNPNRKHNSKFKDNCKGKLFAFCNDRENVCVFISKQSSPFIFSKLRKKEAGGGRGKQKYFCPPHPVSACCSRIRNLSVHKMKSSKIP